MSYVSSNLTTATCSQIERSGVIFCPFCVKPFHESGTNEVGRANTVVADARRQSRLPRVYGLVRIQPHRGVHQQSETRRALPCRGRVLGRPIQSKFNPRLQVLLPASSAAMELTSCRLGGQCSGPSKRSPCIWWKIAPLVLVWIFVCEQVSAVRVHTTWHTFILAESRGVTRSKRSFHAIRAMVTDRHGSVRMKRPR